MKKLLFIIALVSVNFFWGCKPVEQKKEEAALIEKPVLDLKSDRMTPEVLWSFGRVSEPEVSPDRKTVLYGITYYDIAQNKGNRELYLTDIQTREFKRITTTKFSESQATWGMDGKKIYFMSAESGSMQVWMMDPDGKNRKQATNVQNGISGYKLSPDGTMILWAAEVFPENPHKDLYQDIPKATGRIYNDLMYRHWDTWVQSYSHIFWAMLGDSLVTTGKDILFNEPYECPMMPFGGMEQVTWSPDNKEIAYTCRKKKGMEYAISTNSDIFIYNLSNGTTKNISEGIMGYDMVPVYSPDGSKIVWQSMERDGYEADKIRIMMYDVASSSLKDYSVSFDQNAEGMAWSGNNTLYFISDIRATDEIFKLDVTSGLITRVTDGIHNYTSVVPIGDKLIATRMSMSMPVEIYTVDAATGKDSQLTSVNKDLLEKLAFGKVEKRWIKTTDNKDMLTWVIYPSHFDSTKKYPTLLFCEGGPQSTVSQFWSYRWNFQIMAANDYIIVAPNRRGLPGFGKEWLEQISGDYGGQNMKDYLSAIDAMAKEPFVNKDKLGCVGASYGGFSVYWLAGNHQKRFKAFIAHDGMFNLEAQYLETEEMWFVNWDLGGPFWDKNNAVAQRSFSNSPHRFVQNWDTPILCIHGELDYRIVATQGMQAFNAAVLRGIPAQLLYFPDENHWVLKPQNGILWQRTYFNWLDKWLK
jgi:dipeptidyl aminopeptidase/acylaminoacyl peptidase